MSSTAANCFAVVLATACTFGYAPTASATETRSEAVVVARLYKDFGWQAFATQQELFGKDISHQGEAVLKRYFTPALTDLLMKDAACQIKYQGICNLDADILFDSQDPRLVDLDVQTVGSGKVSVTFKDPVTGERTQIDFDMSRVLGTWKIADIIYPAHENLSLRKLLSKKVQ
ncbi:DUF3828 domain-containing protein [Massilia sp. TN1-12]|uniref:DUF3828 domain-containing protein n=1 Tax=Massilia paldalensis TaxID=3377675 RepID=UPI00384A9F2F